MDCPPFLNSSMPGAMWLSFSIFGSSFLYTSSPFAMLSSFLLGVGTKHFLPGWVNSPVKCTLSPGGHTSTPLSGDICSSPERHPFHFTLLLFSNSALATHYSLLQSPRHCQPNMMFVWPFLTRHPLTHKHTHILHYPTSKSLTEVLLKAWELSCVDSHSFDAHSTPWSVGSHPPRSMTHLCSHQQCLPQKPCLNLSIWL